MYTISVHFRLFDWTVQASVLYFRPQYRIKRFPCLTILDTAYVFHPSNGLEFRGTISLDSWLWMVWGSQLSATGGWIRLQQPAALVCNLQFLYPTSYSLFCNGYFQPSVFLICDYASPS